MNSPLFQKKYFKFEPEEEAEEPSQPDNAGSEPEDAVSEPENAITEPDSAAPVAEHSEAAGPNNTLDRPEEGDAPESEPLARKSEEGDAGAAHVSETTNVADDIDGEAPDRLEPENVIATEEELEEEVYDEDDSEDSDDRSVEWNTGESPEPDSESSTNTRYEIRQWFTHVRKAESLWPRKEDRDSSKEWATLFEELDRFLNTERVFHAWLRAYDPQVYFMPKLPIHVAAEFGLTTLVERILSCQRVSGQ